MWAVSSHRVMGWLITQRELMEVKVSTDLTSAVESDTDAARHLNYQG